LARLDIMKIRSKSGRNTNQNRRGKERRETSTRGWDMKLDAKRICLQSPNERS